MPQSSAGTVSISKSVAEVLGVLVRLFFSRFFDKEALSPQGEPESNVVQALGFLASPGAFVALLFLFLPLATSGWNLVALRCFFLSFSMAVMGFITVFEWDALFPNLRDYLILLPLPIPLWTIVLAKAIALSLFLGLFLADINFFATLFWPSIDDGSVYGVIGAHLFVVVMAGLFSALSIASIHGLLLTFAPVRIFRPLATSAQTVLMTGLVMFLFLSPLAAGGVQGLISLKSRILPYVPAFWFSGLYERLRPAVGNSTLVSLGHKALPAVGYALTVLVLTYLPGYRRNARKLIETAPFDASGPGRLRGALNATLDRVLLTSPTQQAVYHFIGQTITRSMKHRLFLAVYAGFGAALVAIGIDATGGEGLAALVTLNRKFEPDHNGLLRVPLTLSFVLISGLRAAFNFPAELSANWAFQIGDTGHAQECQMALRKWIAVCGVAPLFILLAPVQLTFFHWASVLFQMSYGITLSILLVEIVFFDFKKVPFTCAYSPGKINLVLLIVIYVTGFLMYSSMMAILESWLMKTPWSAAAFFLAAVFAALVFWKRLGRAGSELDYLDDGDPEVRTLGLTLH